MSSFSSDFLIESETIVRYIHDLPQDVVDIGCALVGTVQRRHTGLQPCGKVFCVVYLILCLVGTSVVTAANGRVLTATLSFSKPVYLGSLAEHILKYPRLAVAEVYYTYPGETPVFSES